MQGSSTFLHITSLTRGPITPSESLQTDHPHRVCSGLRASVRAQSTLGGSVRPLIKAAIAWGWIDTVNLNPMIGFRGALHRLVFSSILIIILLGQVD